MLRIARLSIRRLLLCQDVLVPGCQDGFLIHQLAVVMFAEPDIDTRPSGGIGIIREATEYSGLRARFRLAYPRRRLFHSFTLSLFPTRAADVDPELHTTETHSNGGCVCRECPRVLLFASTSQPATFPRGSRPSPARASECTFGVPPRQTGPPRGAALQRRRY